MELVTIVVSFGSLSADVGVTADDHIRPFPGSAPVSSGDENGVSAPDPELFTAGKADGVVT